jgi:hypothetical protein
MILCTDNACWISLAFRVLSWIAARRSRGSAMSVASEVNIDPTLLPTSSRSVSVRSDTGH